MAKERFIHDRHQESVAANQQVLGDGVVTGHGTIDGRVVLCFLTRFHGFRRLTGTCNEIGSFSFPG